MSSGLLYAWKHGNRLRATQLVCAWQRGDKSADPPPHCQGDVIVDDI